MPSSVEIFSVTNFLPGPQTMTFASVIFMDEQYASCVEIVRMSA
jgi:hypothetical protein